MEGRYEEMVRRQSSEDRDTRIMPCEDRGLEGCIL